MTKKIALIDSSNSIVGRYTAGSELIQLDISSDADLIKDCDCVMISQEFAGDALGDMLRSVREHSLPVAVTTYSGSCENQERLLELGADDVIILPISVRLLEKRINALTGGSGLNAESIDFNSFKNIADANKGSGSFIVQENDFTNIYRFVLRMLERLDQRAQLVIFDMKCRSNSLIEPEVLHTFVTVVQSCLRRGDISSLHGTQMMVMLMGADREGAENAAHRIVETFYAHCDDDAYDVTFEIKAITN